MVKYIRFLLILLIISVSSIFIYKYRRQLPPPEAPTIIQENGLPNKHLIKSVFVPQAPEKTGISLAGCL